LCHDKRLCIAEAPAASTAADRGEEIVPGEAFKTEEPGFGAQVAPEIGKELARCGWKVKRSA